MKFMSNEYNLEKMIWTESDYDKMGWHDSKIHAISFRPDKFEFLLDLDYIFEWVNPSDNEQDYKFWVSPVTMVFENTYDVCFDIKTDSGLEIQDIKRDSPRKPKNADYISKEIEWLWSIECLQGNISLRSVGYKMYVKSDPILLNTQSFDLDQRNGINFICGKGERAYGI